MEKILDIISKKVEQAFQDAGYDASFGRVTEGMEVADKIVNSKRNMRDKPLVDQKMKSIRVEG